MKWICSVSGSEEFRERGSRPLALALLLSKDSSVTPDSQPARPARHAYCTQLRQESGCQVRYRHANVPIFGSFLHLRRAILVLAMISLAGAFAVTVESFGPVTQEVCYAASVNLKKNAPDSERISGAAPEVCWYKFFRSVEHRQHAVRKVAVLVLAATLPGTRPPM